VSVPDAVPRDMLAYVIDEPGTSGLRQVPVPSPGPGQVLVRVLATALNRKDVFLRGGVRGPGLRQVRYPLVPGAEVVGTVVAAGPAVDGPAVDDAGPAAVREGDVVLVDPTLWCGRCRWCRVGQTSRCPYYGNVGEQCWGGLAQYVVAATAGLRLLPPGTDPVRAAAAPVAFTTAWHALMTAGRLRAGESVLVTGIGGGVATAGLQIAVLAGATVHVSSSSSWKIDRAVALGAAGGVDYTHDDVVGWVRERTEGRGVDVVLDGAGAASWRSSIDALAMGGRLCVYGATTGDSPDISIRELYQSHRSIIGAPMGGRGDLDTVWDLVGRGRLRPVVDSVHRLEQVEEALAWLADGRQFGKVVVEP
jgi:NADPH:quinone reductase-like Zn-dependent oxidoreductase